MPRDFMPKKRFSTDEPDDAVCAPERVERRRDSRLSSLPSKATASPRANYIRT